MVVSVLLNTSMDVQPRYSATRSFWSMQQIIVSEEFIHTVDTVITFRFLDLYIKNLLFDRQTEMWFYLIYGGIKHISNTMYSEMGFNSPHFGFNLSGIGFCLLLLTQHVKKTQKVWIVAEEIYWRGSGVINWSTGSKTLWKSLLPILLSTQMHLSAVWGICLWNMLDNVLYQSYPHNIWKQLKWTLTYQHHQN